MIDSRAERVERWRATLAIVGCGAFYVLASFLPDRRLWGINHLAFLPSSAWVIFAAALLAGIVAVWRWPNRSPIRSSEPRIPEGVLVVGVVIGWVVLTWLARAATPLLGDGYLRADEVAHLKPGTFGIQEFLPGFLASAIGHSLPVNWGLSGRDAIAIVGVFAGFLLVPGALMIWPRVVDDVSAPRDPTIGFKTTDISVPRVFRPVASVARRATHGSKEPWHQVSDFTISGSYGLRRLSALWLVAGGSSVLFFGYTESYALSWAFMSLLTLTLLAHRNGRLGWGWPVVLWVAAVWSHLAALAWVPALLWEIGRPAKSERRRWIAPVIAIGAVAVCVIAIWSIKPARDQLGFQSHLLPLWSTGYSVLDWRHWGDIVNQLLLLAPVALFLLWPNGEKPGGRPSLGNILIFAPTVGALVLFNPQLGMCRDWDLFGLFCAPVVTVLAVVLARRQRMWLVPRLVATVTVAVSATALWVWVNANANASAARFGAILTLDTQRSTVRSGYENLARYWRETGRWDRVVDALGRGLAVGPHARLAIQRGIAFGEMSMPDSALASFQSAVKADTEDPDGHFGVGQTLWMMGRAEESLPYLERAVGMDSTRADYRYHLGMTLRDLHRPRDAQPHLEFAATHNPSQPDYAVASAVTSYDLGNYDSAIATMNGIIQRFPDYNLAYLNLAWILYKTGRFDQARSALTTFEQRQPSNAQDANPKRLRYLLDSVGAGINSR